MIRILQGYFLRLMSRFDRNVRLLGIQEAIRRLVAYSGTKVVARGLTRETAKILKTETVLLVINHPREYEVFALGSVLPPRRTLTVLTNAMFVGLGQALDHYLVPLFLWSRVKQFKLDWAARLMNLLIPQSQMTETEERQRNAESLRFAAKRLRAGHMLLIAPDRRSLNGHWQAGVGRVMNLAGRRTYVAMAHIGGSSAWDNLRYLPGIGRFLPKFTVSFAAPFVYNPADKDARVITAELERIYNSWISSQALVGKQELKLA